MFFFFNDTATTEIYTLSLHDALPISWVSLRDGTLELAIGAHAANNLFGAIVLGFEGSALNTPSLFYADRFVPAYSLIQFLVAAALFYVVVFVLFKMRTKKGP